MSPAAIVTGGSSGIGRAAALKLASVGYDVGITFNTGEERARAVVAEIEALGRRACALQLDLATAARIAPVIDSLADRLGGPDAFVSNAGLNHRVGFLDMALADWNRILAVNLTGAFVATQAAAKRMIGRGVHGAIVNVGSVLDREVLEGGAAYCSSKGGLRQLTRVMALELAAYGIRVNGVAPGETATPMNFVGDVDASSIRRPVTPLGRPGYSSEVAETIAFLLSKAAAYVTGEVLLVDGGLSLHGGPQALQVAVGRPAPLAVEEQNRS